MFEAYTEEARRAVEIARGEAARLGRRSVEPHHLLVAILKNYPRTADRLLRSGGCTSAELLPSLEALFPAAPRGEARPEELPFSWESRGLFAKAQKCARQHGHDWIGLEHLMVGLVSYPQASFTWLRNQVVAKVFLQEHGIYRTALDAAIHALEQPFDGQRRSDHGLHG